MNTIIEVINYKGVEVPKFQAEGNAMQWVKPYAERLCKGIGVEVGVNRVEWMAFKDSYEKFVPQEGVEAVFTNFYNYCQNELEDSAHSFPIDPMLDTRFNAVTFPEECIELDYIINSHVLEHLPNVVEALEYWKSALKIGGLLFTYLPSYKSEYWKIQNNRKHLHEFSTPQVKKLLEDLGFTNVFVSETDLNNSILAICNK